MSFGNESWVRTWGAKGGRSKVTRSCLHLPSSIVNLETHTQDYLGTYVFNPVYYCLSCIPRLLCSHRLLFSLLSNLPVPNDSPFRHVCSAPEAALPNLLGYTDHPRMKHTNGDLQNTVSPQLVPASGPAVLASYCLDSPPVLGCLVGGSAPPSVTCQPIDLLAIVSPRCC